MEAAPGPQRIGPFARRVGVSPELLRAWEQRYSLLRPQRSPGGFRLYTDEDAERVERMRRAMAEGLSAAEAAQVALSPRAPSAGLADAAPRRLLAAVERFDEDEVHAVLDDGLAAIGLEATLRDIILPVLRDVGSAWAAGRLQVAHEHFVSHVIRGRLLALARLWGRGGGPLALLACAPGEAHDITLLAFGLLLRSYGWRILFLGADTPAATLLGAVTDTRPDVVVIASFAPGPLTVAARSLRRLGRSVRVVVAGPGAAAVGADLKLERLDGDLLSAARSLAADRRA